MLCLLVNQGGKKREQESKNYQNQVWKICHLYCYYKYQNSYKTILGTRLGKQIWQLQWNGQII